MSKRKFPFILVLILCLTSQLAISQTVFRGTVLDEQSKKPIDGAKIGISGQGVGVLTNDKGAFAYKKYDETLNSDSKLTISAVGYQPIQKTAKEIRSLWNSRSTIYLSPSKKSITEESTVKSIAVFWDASAALAKRSINTEINQLSTYLQKHDKASIRLVVYREEVILDKKFRHPLTQFDEIKEVLENVSYSGGANYDNLISNKVDKVLLFSNGMPLFGTLAVSQEIPVEVVISQKVNYDAKYLNRLVAYTSGKFNLVNSTGRVTDVSTNTTSTQKELIKGKVSSLGIGLDGASISIGNSLTEYISDVDGNFEIPAKFADDIKFNYFGMFPKTVKIQNVQDFLNVEMIPKSDQLDEVVLVGQKAQKVIVGRRTLKGSDGRMKATGDEFITSENIPENAKRLEDILKVSFPAVTYAFGPYGMEFKVEGGRVPFYLDEVLVGAQVPYVAAEDIETIIVKTNGMESNRYGPYVRGRAIFVVTKKNALAKEKHNPLVKGNDYKESLDVLPSNTSFKESIVQGKVLGPQGPIQGASIIKKGSFDEYTSDANGAFAIPAESGDAIVFSYLGMYSKGELIQDLDKELLVNLVPQNELLDEVVISGSSKEGETVETAYGVENKDKIGYATNSLKGDDIKQQYQFLSDVLRGQFAGVQVLGQGSNVRLIVRQGGQTFGGANDSSGPLFVIDNSLISGTSLSEINSFVDVQNIEKITILKSYASTNIYGSLAVDGAVVIKTKTGEGTFSKDKKASSLLVKGNDYQETPLENITAKAELPSYIKELQQIPAIDARFDRYKDLKEGYETDIEFFVDMALYFKKYDSQKTQEILSELTLKGKNNVKVLRTVAYIYESLNEEKQAQNLYERILKLEPNAAQSYRDVAMIYQYTGAYDKALELYINMLGEQIKGVDFSGLEKPLISELSRLVAQHKDKIDFKRLPNEWLKTDFNIDVRMIVEWSDRSVPFEFQFVNPNKKYFRWTHDLGENRERLEAEQKQGFQTEEFIIDDAPSGEWLVNIQYLGLEGDFVLPPFMKYTIYKDFGTVEETREVRVVKLFRQVDKVTLGKIQI